MYRLARYTLKLRKTNMNPYFIDKLDAAKIKQIQVVLINDDGKKFSAISDWDVIKDLRLKHGIDGVETLIDSLAESIK